MCGLVEVEEWKVLRKIDFGGRRGQSGPSGGVSEAEVVELLSSHIAMWKVCKIDSCRARGLYGSYMTYFRQWISRSLYPKLRGGRLLMFRQHLLLKLCEHRYPRR